MIKLLRWLLTGDVHMHTYEVYKTYKHYYNQYDQMPSHHVYVNRCTVCGKIKITTTG